MANSKVTLSTFLIEEKYQQYPELIAQVWLEVNYATKTFNIKPHHSSQFIFKTGSKTNILMWKAVNKCIEKALEVADAELFNPPPKQA